MSKTENIYNTTLEIIDYAVANGIYDASCGAYHCSNRIDQRKIDSKVIYFNKVKSHSFQDSIEKL
jgi:hypothetical protein